MYSILIRTSIGALPRARRELPAVPARRAARLPRHALHVVLPAHLPHGRCALLSTPEYPSVTLSTHGTLFTSLFQHISRTGGTRALRLRGDDGRNGWRRHGRRRRGAPVAPITHDSSFACLFASLFAWEIHCSLARSLACLRVCSLVCLFRLG